MVKKLQIIKRTFFKTTKTKAQKQIPKVDYVISQLSFSLFFKFLVNF